MAKDTGPITPPVNKEAQIQAMAGGNPEMLELLTKLLTRMDAATATSDVDYELKRLELLSKMRVEEEFQKKKEEQLQRTRDVIELSLQGERKRKFNQSKCGHIGRSGLTMGPKVMCMTAPANKAIYMCTICAKLWHLQPNGEVLDEDGVPLPSSLHPNEDQIGGYSR